MADIASDLLTEMGIQFKLVKDMPISKIVVGTKSQVRRSTHIAPEKTVAQFAHQMKAGAQFPPVVICAATQEVADGNTRLASRKKNGETTVDAYVADFGSLIVRQFFAGRINQQGGARLDTEEAKKLAVKLIEEGTEPAMISLGLGVSASEVEKWAGEVEARARLAGKLTDKQTAKLMPNHYSRLNTVKLDAVMLEAAKLFADAGMGTGETSRKIAILNGKTMRSEKDALDAITEWRKEKATSIKKTKAGVGSKKPSAAACISLAHANLLKRTLDEYEVEMNGAVSPIVVSQVEEIVAFAESLVEILTRPKVAVAA